MQLGGQEALHYGDVLGFSTDSRLRNIFMGYSTEDRLPSVAPENVSGFDGRALERPRCKWDNSKMDLIFMDPCFIIIF
jgi:hypothetical protein